MEERLQKLISASGLVSRRQAEAYIKAGRVQVNGQIAQLGQKADPACDQILVDGRPILQTDGLYYLMLHKPRGYVTTMQDEKGRKTAAQLVADFGHRVYPVGRLDMDSEGLLLFTNDGALTNHLLHPAHEVEKEYQVRVRGNLRTALPILQGPLELDGIPLAPARVTLLRRTEHGGILSVVIHQGKNRQVRRMCDLAGLEVLRLKRIREGNLLLGDLPGGTWRELTDEEVAGLRRV